MKKDLPKRKTPLFFTLKSLSKREQLFFYFIGTLNRVYIHGFWSIIEATEK